MWPKSFSESVYLCKFIQNHRMDELLYFKYPFIPCIICQFCIILYIWHFKKNVISLLVIWDWKSKSAIFSYKSKTCFDIFSVPFRVKDCENKIMGLVFHHLVYCFLKYFCIYIFLLIFFSSLRIKLFHRARFWFHLVLVIFWTKIRITFTWFMLKKTRIYFGIA